MKTFKDPEIKRVNLVPKETVLVVCKNHEVADPAVGYSYCSHPAINNISGTLICQGVTGS